MTRRKINRQVVILEEHHKKTPECKLWEAVIRLAVNNVFKRRQGWEDDFYFLSGNENFNWICELLGVSPKATSIRATRTAFGKKITN